MEVKHDSTLHETSKKHLRIKLCHSGASYAASVQYTAQKRQYLTNVNKFCYIWPFWIATVYTYQYKPSQLKNFIQNLSLLWSEAPHFTEGTYSSSKHFFTFMTIFSASTKSSLFYRINFVWFIKLHQDFILVSRNSRKIGW